MWFTPVKASSKEMAAGRLLQRVMNITDVVAACRDSGFEWLEQLLENVSGTPVVTARVLSTVFV
jgi:cohesin loading factor subunit SCC2